MGHVRHVFLRGGSRSYTGRIRQRPRWSPPHTDRMLVVFDLAGVGEGDLGVVADCVVDLTRSFPTILRRGIDVLVIVPAIRSRRGDIRLRHQSRNADDVRVIVGGGHCVSARGQAVRLRVSVLPHTATRKTSVEGRTAAATRYRSRPRYAVDRGLAEIA